MTTSWRWSPRARGPCCQSDAVGCVTEARLLERDIAVTAVPIDSIIAAAAARPGLEVAYGSFEECLGRLVGRVFDCVLMTDLLHLLPDPRHVIEECSRFVREGGSFVISGPNFGSLRVIAKRAIDKGGYRKLRSYNESGINLVSPNLLKRYLKPSGLRISAVCWSMRLPVGKIESRLGRWGGASWVVRAQRETI